MSFRVPEKYRILTGPLASSSNDGNNGAFIIRSIKLRKPLNVMASDGLGWEHVSVSLPNRCPTWEEMCIIKDIFWGQEDWVIQFHPPKSEYINNHPYCLHLWRPSTTDVKIPTPDNLLIGLK